MSGRVMIGALLLALPGAPRAFAAPSCSRTCVARMASCRAERCPDATGEDRRHCRDVCRALTGCTAGAARTRTIATVVTECRAAGGMWTGRQRLEIRRGECPPVPVMTVDANEPAVDLGVCTVYGQFRQGAGAMSIGAFQGLAVSRDGGTVVFQVTDDFAGLVIGGVTIPAPRFPLATEGIFVVRSDGTDLHRIASQSRQAPFTIRPSPDPSLGPVSIATSNVFDFSPDGKAVVLVDRGPGSDGSDAPQIFTLDPITGARRQLTTFTASAVGGEQSPGLAIEAVFIDDRRIGAKVWDRIEGRTRVFIMARDGTDMGFVQDPSPIQGARVIPDFGVVGGAKAVFSLTFPDRPTDQPRPGHVQEIFARDGKRTLQLTNYGRADTSFPTRLRDGDQVVFRASADPLGLNPQHAHQLFRIDRLGGHLRQLTRFPFFTSAAVTCTNQPTPRCLTPVNAFIKQDRVTGSLIFDSSCDPFGVSPVSQQVYAIRPDGTGLRQVTNYRGFTCDGGAVSVELPGPIAHSAPFL